MGTEELLVLLTRDPKRRIWSGQFNGKAITTASLLYEGHRLCMILTDVEEWDEYELAAMRQHLNAIDAREGWS